MNHRPGQMLDAAVWVAWALTGWLLWQAAERPPRAVRRSLRICGAELDAEVADQPWVCIRPRTPTPSNIEHPTAPRGPTNPDATVKFLVCNSVAEGCQVASNLRDCACGTQL